MPGDEEAIHDVLIKDLKTGQSYKNRVLKAKVVTVYDLVKRRPNTLRKLVVQQGSGDDAVKLNVFLINHYADQCNKVAINDVIKLSDFHVEPSTHKTSDGTSPYQVVIDKSRTPATVVLEMAGKNTANDRQGATNKKTYTYTTLRDLEAGTVVNVYAVVKFFKQPHVTRCGEHFQLISLIDPSLDSVDERLPCNVFAPSRDRLPQVKAVGDIVRFHRLRVTTFNDKLQGQSGPGFASLVFDGKGSNSFEPRTGSATYTLSEADKKKVQELRNWCETLDDLGASQVKLNHITNVYLNQYLDLTCQVVATAVVEPDTSILLRVWDGTIIHRPVHKVDLSVGCIVLKEDKELVRRANDYLVDVFVYDDHYQSAARVKPGDYIELLNLHAGKHKDQDGSHYSIVPKIEFALHKGTAYGRKLVILDPADVKVRELKKLLDAVPEPDTMDTTDASPVAGPSHMTSDLHSGINSNASGYTDVLLLAGLDNSSAQATGAGEHSSSGASWAGRKRSRDGSTSTATKKQKTEVPGPSQQDRCLLRTATVTSAPPLIPFSRIQEVLEKTPPAKFKLRAQLVDYQPHMDSPTAFLQLYCPQCHFLSSLSKLREEELASRSKSETIHAKLLAQIEDKKVYLSSLDDSYQTWQEIFLTLPTGRVKAKKLVTLFGEPVQDEPVYSPDLSDLNIMEMKKMGRSVVVISEIEDSSLWNTETESLPVAEYCITCPQCSSLQSQGWKERATQGPNVNGVPILQYIYHLKLLLRDNTGWITVLLWKEEAERFFLSTPAADLVKPGNHGNLQNLRTRMDRLCPVTVTTGSQGDHPWMECCVTSYRTTGGVSYQMFDTELAID